MNFFLAVGLSACTPEPAETDRPLPPEDTDYVRDTDVVEFPEDTSLDSDLDVTPQHTLTMHQFGEWDLSAPDALVGRLRVQEWVDDDAPDNDTAETDGIIEPPDTDAPLLPPCDLTFALTGVPATEVALCTGCDAPWEITFALSEGSPAACHDPELPPADTSRVMAFHPADEQIYLNFGNIDLWLPWYTASRTADRVTFEWIATVGVSIDEDMDD